MIGPLADPFLEAANDRRLALQVCRTCGSRQLPPIQRCAHCDGRHLEWVDSPGIGSIESFAILHRAPGPPHDVRTPYVLALVVLAEGPRVVTNIVGCPPEKVAVGQHVQVVFERVDEEGQMWPEFAPRVGG